MLNITWNILEERVVEDGNDNNNDMLAVPGGVEDMWLPEPEGEGDIEEAGNLLAVLHPYCPHVPEPKTCGVGDRDEAGDLGEYKCDFCDKMFTWVRSSLTTSSESM